MSAKQSSGMSPTLHMCLLALARHEAEHPGETSTARMMASRKLVDRGFAERVDGKKGLRITPAGLAYCREHPDELLPRRYTFKLYPTAAQAEALDRQRRLHCDLWNALLQQREEAWSRRGAERPMGKSLTEFDQVKELAPLRAAFPEYAELSADSMALTVQRLDRAFQAFFRRAKEGAGAAAGYPRFTPWRLYPGFGFKRHRSGWALTLERGRSAGRLYVKGCPGTIKLRGQLPAEPVADYRSCDLTWRDGAWWLSVVTVMAPRRAAAPGAIIVDLDVDRGEIRVARPDGARGPAPFAACDGRNHQPDEADAAASAAEAGHSGGDRGDAVADHLDPDAAEAGHSGGDRGKMPRRRADSCAAEAGHSGGDRGRTPLLPDGSGAAEAGHSGGDRGTSGTWCGRPRAAEASSIGTAADERDAACVVALQQGMARCKKGSVAYRKRRARKSKVEARMRRRRADRMHRLTTRIAEAAADVTLVTLAVPKEATKSAKGSETRPGALVDIRAEINRRILAQAPAAFRAALEYKVAEAGGKLVVEERKSLAAEAGQVVGEAVIQARRLRAKAGRGNQDEHRASAS